ncbi:unnamed protein product [Phaeothamnion confervicola]
MEMVVTASVAAPLSLGPSGSAHPPGLRVVRVYQGRIEHSYYALDDVPAEVTLSSEP